MRCYINTHLSTYRSLSVSDFNSRMAACSYLICLMRSRFCSVYVFVYISAFTIHPCCTLGFSDIPRSKVRWFNAHLRPTQHSLSNAVFWQCVFGIVRSKDHDIDCQLITFLVVSNYNVPLTAIVVCLCCILAQTFAQILNPSCYSCLWNLVNFRCDYLLETVLTASTTDVEQDV